ncbi:MAG: TatD family hydrolase [Endomicrobia bacterium]|nr:TatD family hydrolase [Endomicrobiia bacterium]
MFETHSHLFDEKIISELDIILENLNSSNFLGVICICENEKDIEYFIKYSAKYKFLYCSLGIHPHNAKNYDEKKFLEMFKKLQKTNRLLAIGEIGLDFYYNFSNPQQQIQSFNLQLDFAKKYELPVIIHSRKSKDILYEILKQKNIKKGILHCFSEDYEFAKKIIDLGLMLGVSGIITFDKSESLKETFKNVDVSFLVLETDSPYLTPSPYRGKVNNPLYLKYILETLAKIKKIEVNELEKITDYNALKVFNLI